MGSGLDFMAELCSQARLVGLDPILLVFKLNIQTLAAPKLVCLILGIILWRGLRLNIGIWLLRHILFLLGIILSLLALLLISPLGELIRAVLPQNIDAH